MEHPWSEFGGPAYPVSDGHTTWCGMTLRDYFAGQAIAALIQRHRADMAWGDMAPQAYRIADEMLKARKA